MSLSVEDLSNKLWKKRREKFPERTILDEMLKVMEELGRVADSALRMHRRARQQKVALENELRAEMKDKISDVMITLITIAKDLDIDIWKALKERMVKEIERHL